MWPFINPLPPLFTELFFFSRPPSAFFSSSLSLYLPKSGKIDSGRSLKRAEAIQVVKPRITAMSQWYP